jgi:hypothetical protein
MSETFKDQIHAQDSEISLEQVEIKLRPIDATDMSDEEIDKVLRENLSTEDIARIEDLEKRKRYIINAVLLSLEIIPDISTIIDSSHDYAIKDGKRPLIEKAKEIKDDIHIAEQILEDKRTDLPSHEYRDFRWDVGEMVDRYASETNLYRAFEKLQKTDIISNANNLKRKGLVQAHLLAYILLYKNIQEKHRD